jgi:hypothetical protein
MTMDKPRQKQAVAAMLQQVRKDPGVEYATTLNTAGGQRTWATTTCKVSDAQIDQLIQSLKGPGEFETSAKKK